MIILLFIFSGSKSPKSPSRWEYPAKIRSYTSDWLRQISVLQGGNSKIPTSTRLLRHPSEHFLSAWRSAVYFADIYRKGSWIRVSSFPLIGTVHDFSVSIPTSSNIRDGFYVCICALNHVWNLVYSQKIQISVVITEKWHTYVFVLHLCSIYREWKQTNMIL